MLEKARRQDPLLVGRKVLVVDDDVRNIFALNTVLERYGMQVVFAESAQEGIDLLEREPGVELVLMDVMMPEMDGYQAMRAIRGMERFGHLPILALTAKAHEGRPREVPGGRRVRLHHQAGGHRQAAQPAARLAARAARRQRPSAQRTEASE